jgi:hypothetical protein
MMGGWVIGDMSAIEAMRRADRHCRANGEWFNLTGADVAAQRGGPFYLSPLSRRLSASTKSAKILAFSTSA